MTAFLTFAAAAFATSPFLFSSFEPFASALPFCFLNGDSTTTVSEETFEFLFCENVFSPFALFSSTLLFDSSSVDVAQSTL